MESTVNVLLVEDNPGDARLIREALKENLIGQVEVKCASRLSEALERLDSAGIDVILLDLGLPDSQGLETLAQACKAGNGIPIIVITGRAGESLAAAAVRNGAEDYLVKGQVASQAIIRSIRYSMERRLFREALKESEDRYRLMIETSEEGIWLVDSGHRTVFVNPKMASLLGHTSGEMQGKPALSFVDSADHATLRDKIEHSKNGVREQYDLRFRRKDGTLLWALCSASPVFDELGRYQGALGMLTDITERKGMEERLQRSEARLSRAQRIARMGSWEWDLATSQAYWSDEVYGILGLPGDKTPGRELFMSTIHPDDRDRVARAIEGSFAEGTPFRLDHRVVLGDGVVKVVNVQAEVVFGAGGKPLKLIGTVIDVTDRTVLEGKLLQSQKVEAIGRLAGGVAHDFNNILTVISGYTQLAYSRLELDDPARPELEEVLRAGDRAAGLTRQLLAFSRKQILTPKLISLNSIVGDMDKMLRRLIEEQVELSTGLDPALASVKADPGQIEQVIMNLAINARDAMPQGGKLRIETSNVTLDEPFVRSHPGSLEGSHVMMIVRDSGSGMTPETMAHLFEPFYTTKGQGKGTGLGLATVYGIIKQSGGYISVSSNPGHGTIFRIYLPSVAGEAVPTNKSTKTPIKGGTETILLVEDEPAVRTLTAGLLKSSGYDVLIAADPREALAIAESPAREPQLLLTDVIMPGMSGRELCRQMSERRPNLKTLYMTGYTESMVIGNGHLEAGVEFLQKPFIADDLLAKVRRVLDS